MTTKYLVDAWQFANAMAALRMLNLKFNFVRVVDKNPNGIAHNYKVLLEFKKPPKSLEETQLLTLYGEVITADEKGNSSDVRGVQGDVQDRRSEATTKKFRFNHEYIGTEHVLLGLILEGSGVAANVLRNLDVDLRKVRLEVEKCVHPKATQTTCSRCTHRVWVMPHNLTLPMPVVCVECGSQQARRTKGALGTARTYRKNFIVTAVLDAHSQRNPC
jgi:hypothetical protein